MPRARLDRDVAADALGTQPVDCAIARDARQPGGRRSQPGVVGLGAGPDPDERLLQHVFRSAGPQDPHDDAVGQPAVPVVTGRQGGIVAGRDALEEIEIPRCCC